MSSPSTCQPNRTRRHFLKTTVATVGAGGLASLLAPAAVHASEDSILKIGLIGCGGRGSGAAVQALTADENTRLVAVADAFADQAERSLTAIRRSKDAQVDVPPERVFVGFDAYKKVIDSDVDIVLLACTPHFRPIHLRAAIEAGKHVFAEKPVAVDPTGVRSVLETTQLAHQKGLCIVSGLCWRYETNTIEMMRRLHDGAIGNITSLDTTRYGGGVWVRERKPGMTDMQYQMRNWYYFTWLSGDFITEQFVHELDRMAWVMGNVYPDSCLATGGRQTYGPEKGHTYDHFAAQYVYPNGTKLFATTRHQKGCDGRFTVEAVGTKGHCDLQKFEITGENPWQSGQRRTVMHQLEHDAFFAALRKGEVINNGEYMARSTMMAIIARMSAYTGKALTWKEAMESPLKLAPAEYAWDAAPPPAKVAIPGLT